MWVLVASALVFFMQAGFTRAKNAGNIIMKNLMDFAIGVPIHWLLGFHDFAGSTAVHMVGGRVRPVTKPEEQIFLHEFLS